MISLFSPQAFSGETHSHGKEGSSASTSSEKDHEDRHSQNVYYGLMSLAGIIGFLAFERILTIVSDLCSKTHGNTPKVCLQSVIMIVCCWEIIMSDKQEAALTILRNIRFFTPQITS
jgi:hypothetical protein